MSISTLARVFTPHGNIVYTANDFRQTLRIVFAGMIALSISSFYNTSYGVFFVVYPIMLLSLVPVFNREAVYLQRLAELHRNGVYHRLSVPVAGHYDAGGVCPVRDAFSLYE